jgi:hypothetical protein
MLTRDEDEYSNCPLLGRSIDMGECYDIQMVRDGFINESVLSFRLNRAKSEQVCMSCPSNQLVAVLQGEIVHA